VTGHSRMSQRAQCKKRKKNTPDADTPLDSAPTAVPRHNAQDAHRSGTSIRSRHACVRTSLIPRSSTSTCKLVAASRHLIKQLGFARTQALHTRTEHSWPRAASCADGRDCVAQMRYAPLESASTQAHERDRVRSCLTHSGGGSLAAGGLPPAAGRSIRGDTQCGWRLITERRPDPAAPGWRAPPPGPPCCRTSTMRATAPPSCPSPS